MGAVDGPHPEDGEAPARAIHQSAYRIGRTTITNRVFSKFVSVTGYQTLAEQHGGSHVFQGQLSDPEQHPLIATIAPWWRWVTGASWRKPDGRHDAQDNLPVVHVSLADALAFCDWSGTRLPTEAEWEQAAGSQKGITPHIWQGEFPNDPLVPPGPRPANDAIANEFGVIHACGNVWEWTADRFTKLHSPRPDFNPKGPLNGQQFVVKGGSFLCSPSYCARYRPSSRRAESPDATTSHLGFRVATT